MAEIVFSCINCGAEVEADSSMGGGSAQCPACNATILIPMPGIKEGMKLGDFVIKSKLGAGGMGEVWLADQPSMEREVALKILSPALALDQDFLARFREEVKTAGKLQHPNIVTAFHAGFDSGVNYLAISYVDGFELEHILKTENLLEEKRALKIAREIAEALKYAWNKHRILHRDIKPANIMLDSDGEAKLMDMGISKSLAEDKNLTMTGLIVGSPYYMSPEQARADKNIDCRSDIYSLGATLYNLVTGEVPYDASTIMGILSKLITEPFPPPQDKNPKLSDECAVLLEVMMAKDPELRPQTWEDVISEIDRVVNEKMPATPRPNVGDSLIMQQTASQSLSKRKVFKKSPKAKLSRTVQPTPESVESGKASGSKTPLIAAAAACLLLVAGLAIYIAASGGNKDKSPETSAPDAENKPETPSSAPSETEREKPKVSPAEPEPVPAKTESLSAKAKEQQKMWEFADNFAKDNPLDFTQTIALFEKVKSSCKGTRYELMAETEIAKLSNLRKKLDDEKAAKIAEEKRKAEEEHLAAIRRKEEQTEARRKVGVDRKRIFAEVADLISKGGYGLAKDRIDSEPDEKIAGDSGLKKLAGLVRELSDMDSLILGKFQNSTGKKVSIGGQEVIVSKVENGVIHAEIRAGQARLVKKYAVSNMSTREKIRHLDGMDAAAKAVHFGVLAVRMKKYEAAEKYFAKIADSELAPLGEHLKGKVLEFQMGKKEAEAKRDFEKIANAASASIRDGKMPAPEAKQLLEDINAYRTRHEGAKFLQEQKNELDKFLETANSSIEAAEAAKIAPGISDKKLLRRIREALEKTGPVLSVSPTDDVMAKIKQLKPGMVLRFEKGDWGKWRKSYSSHFISIDCSDVVIEGAPGAVFNVGLSINADVPIDKNRNVIIRNLNFEYYQVDSRSGTTIVNVNAPKASLWGHNIVSYNCVYGALAMPKCKTTRFINCSIGGIGNLLIHHNQEIEFENCIFSNALNPNKTDFIFKVQFLDSSNNPHPFNSTMEFKRCLFDSTVPIAVLHNEEKQRIATCKTFDDMKKAMNAGRNLKWSDDCIFKKTILVDPGKDDFRLAPGSPGRGAGPEGRDLGARINENGVPH